MNVSETRNKSFFLGVTHMTTVEVKRYKVLNIKVYGVTNGLSATL